MLLKSFLFALFAVFASTFLIAQNPCEGDAEVPQITCSNPPTVFLDASGAAFLPITDVAAGTDDCAISSWAFSFDNQNFTTSEVIPFSCFHANASATTAVWVKACDAAGNCSESCFLQISVLEFEPPTVVCETHTESLGALFSGQIELFEIVFQQPLDNCGGPQFLDFEPLSVGCAEVGSTVSVTVLVADASGNIGSCEAFVEIIDVLDNDGDGILNCQDPCPNGDSQPPTVTCSNPPTQFLEAPNFTLEMPISDAASATDDCDAPFSWSYSFDNSTFLTAESVPFSCFNANSSATTAVWVKATDASGNASAACFFQVSILENEAPTANCIQNHVETLSPIGTGLIELFEIALSPSDNCGGPQFLPFSPVSIDCDDAGTTVSVVVLVQDASGNLAECTAFVQIFDLDNDSDGIGNCSDPCPDGEPIWWPDWDGDGFGFNQYPVMACEQPSGYVANNLDCQEGCAACFPNAPELCDGLDNDCDGSVDEGVLGTFYFDADQDGFGTPLLSQQNCPQWVDQYWVLNADDCNDNSAAARPGANEICDGIDNDCDGQIDESTLVLTAVSTSIACFGGNSTATATATGGLAPFQFSFDWGPFSAQNSKNLVAGLHAVIVKDAANCTRQMTLNIAQPPFLQITSTISQNPNGKFKITATASGGSPSYQFRRSNGSGWTGWGSSGVFNNLLAGTFTIQTRDLKNCTAQQMVSVGVLLEKGNDRAETDSEIEILSEKAMLLAVLPNPADRFFNLKINEKSAAFEAGEARLTITDELGRPVFDQKISFEKGETGPIDCQNWPEGLFFAHLQIEGERRRTAKLVVVHE